MRESGAQRTLVNRVSLGVLNMTLRGLGLVGRFALLFYLVRFLDLNSVALFGLVYAGVAMAPPFLNFGLHFRMNREIVGTSDLESGHRLRDRLWLHILTYTSLALVAVSAAATFGYLALANVKFACLVLIVGILDVLLNEIHLFLISRQRPLLANTIYFLRSSAWIFPFLISSFLIVAWRNLDSVFIFWISGQIIGLLMFFGALYKWPWRNVWRKRVDFSWLFVDLNKSAMIWLSDIGTVVGQFIDRFVLGLFLSTHSIGIYVFFWSLANGAQQLVYTGIVQIVFPHFVSASRSANNAEFRRLLISELKNVLIVSILMCGLMFCTAPLIYAFSGRPTLSENGALFAELLLGTVIRLGADLTGIALYARGHASQIAAINITTPVISVVFASVALTLLGFNGIGIAFIGTNFTLLALRLYALRGDIRG